MDKDFNAGAFDPVLARLGRLAWGHVNAAGPAQTRPPHLHPAACAKSCRCRLQNLWNDEQTGTSVARHAHETRRSYAKLPPGVIAAPNAPIDQVETLNTALRRYRVTAMTSEAGYRAGDHRSWR